MKPRTRTPREPMSGKWCPSHGKWDCGESHSGVEEYEAWLLRGLGPIQRREGGKVWPILEPMPAIRCVVEPPCKWEPGCWYCQKAKEKR